MTWDLRTMARMNKDPGNPCLQPSRTPLRMPKCDPFIAALKEEALGEARRQGVQDPWVNATVGEGQVTLQVYEGTTGTLKGQKEIDITDSRHDRL